MSALEPAQLVVIGSLVVLAIELIRGKREPAQLFAAVVLLYLALGLVDVPAVLHDLSNPGLATVVLLVVLSAVIDKARILDRAVAALVVGRYRWALLKLGPAVAAYSAFLNNTAVVASLIGPLRRAGHHSASRMLLPACYAASLGGVLTLVGTSTNLLVSGLLVGSGRPALSMFDTLPVGAVALVAGVVAMVLAHPWLLPDHADVPPAHDGYFVEARVRDGSRLVGRTVEANGLRSLHHLFLCEIVRDGRLIAPVAPDQVIAAGDELVFAGDVDRLDLLAGFDGLELYVDRHGLRLDNLVEVVVIAGGTVARRTLRELDFRSQFDAAVVAIRRGGQRLSGGLGATPLEVGDLLVLAVGNDFEKRTNVRRNFLVVSRPALAKFVDRRKDVAAVGGFALAIALGASGVVDFTLALLMLLAVFLAARFTSSAELRRSFPFALVIVMGGALVVSSVMARTGTAGLLAAAVVAPFEGWGDRGAVASVLILAWVLTELMTNNAAAALALPIALAIAERQGLAVMPLVMAVLFGASASFLTPHGYQTNLMVMGPGRYTTADFLRAGTPVAVAYLLAVWITIPLFFPLRAA